MKRNCRLRISPSTRASTRNRWVQADCGSNKAIIRTPLGWVGVAVSDKGVCRVVLPRKGKRAVLRELESAECGVRSAETSTAAVRRILYKAVRTLQNHFSGKRVLSDLPVDVRYYTAFQRSVWRAASAIPFGETRSYGWIAKQLKKPLAARAVGQAMGANPVPVIIP